jgi:hypothetical protein
MSRTPTSCARNVGWAKEGIVIFLVSSTPHTIGLDSMDCNRGGCWAFVSIGNTAIVLYSEDMF